MTRSKYGAKPTTIMHAGKEVRCASKAEAKRLGELVLLERAKKIECLTFHPRFPLSAYSLLSIDKQEKVATYVADASYRSLERGNSILIVEEIKGFETPEWKLKRKLFAANYPAVDLRVIRA